MYSNINDPNGHRNQFLSNANGSTDALQRPPRPPRPDISLHSRLDSQGSVDGFYFAPQGNLLSAFNNAKNDPFEYELSTLPDASVSREPLINPFSDQRDGPSRSNYNNTYPYYEEDERSKDPFNNPLPDLPYGAPFEKAQPPLPAEEESFIDRQRRNERARIKQLRRKPRFHYTRLPYFTMVVTLIQVVVFIVELAKMADLTGSAFQTKPYFNPMLGPSTYVLINMGARYVPCMHQIQNVTDDPTIQFPCANSTSTDTNVCLLAELCGLSGLPIKNDVYVPDQWYRVVTPIFLHAGFLHILFNLLLQVTMGGTIERKIGLIKYAIIYLSSGVGGFLLGANFTPEGIASTGASGALFGIVATNILMFIYCGKKNTNLYGTKHFGLFLAIMVAEIVISLALGLLPGLDNFSHIGGFCVGILSGILVLTDPFFVFVDGIITYDAHANTWQQFLNNWNPFYAWEDKLQTPFIIWCGVRAVALALFVVYFAMLAQNLRHKSNGNQCKWCKYINCIPVHGWCDVGQVQIESQTSPSSSSSAAPSGPSPMKGPSSEPTLPSSIENGNNRRWNVFENADFAPISGPEARLGPALQLEFSTGATVVAAVFAVIAYQWVKMRQRE